MSNKPSQEQINNYLANREKYKQNYLTNRQQTIYIQKLYIEQQNYIKKQSFKNKVLTDVYLGESRQLKRTFNSNPNFIPSLIQFLKDFN